MSKKKKDKIEEQPKKTKTVKSAAKTEQKSHIVPPGMPVLVPTSPAAPIPASPSESAGSAAAPKVSKPKKAAARKKSAGSTSGKKKKAVGAEVVVGGAEEIVISQDDIALRAYFISEARRARGEGGDPTGDWLEAERQLRAEAAAKKNN
jgi:hypothetical protein